MSRTATGTVDFHGTPPRWWARVTVTDEAGGKRRPWVDLERPDLRNTPEDKAIARRLARKRAKLAAKKTYVGPERATAPRSFLADHEDKWFANLESDPDLRPKTVARYKQSWVQIVEALGKTPVAELSPVRIRDWVWKRRNERSTSTVLNDCNALSHFFKVAIREKWIPQTTSPMRDDLVKDAKPQQTTRNPDDIARYTQDEAERLLGAEAMPDVVFGLLLTDLTTGERDGESQGLQFVHLKDPRDGKACVNVLQQVVFTDAEGLHLGPPKWGSKRMIPQHPQLADWLAWWRAEGWQKYVGRKPTDADFVFPDADGNMARPKNAELLRKWAAKAKVPTHFTLSDGTKEAMDMNSLRHTFSSLLGELDVDGEVLDALMGHKPKTVRGRHYMAISFERKARALARLRLVLPTRPGVVPSPPESSNESSEAPEEVDDAPPESGRQVREDVAEEEGFEPTDALRRRRFSKPVP